MRSIIICLLLSAVAVSADLQSDFDEIERHLPMDQLALIGHKYIAENPSMSSEISNISPKAFEQIIRDFVKSKPLQPIVEYLARRGINAERIIAHLALKVESFHRRLLNRQSAGQARSSMPKLSGDFAADCFAAIQSSKVPAVINEKLENSADFANFVDAVSDPEFNALMYRVSNDLPEGPQGRGFFSKVWNSVKKGLMVAGAVSILG